MNTEEIMVNEEVMEAVEESVVKSSGNGWKKVGIAAAAVALGVLAYKGGKKLVKVIKERKAKKENPIDITQKDIDDIVNDEL